MASILRLIAVLFVFALASSAAQAGEKAGDMNGEAQLIQVKPAISKFAVYKDELDLASLPESEARTLAKLLEAIPYIDRIFWLQNSHYGLGQYLAMRRYKKIADKYVVKLMEIHYGRWDRTEENAAFFGDPGHKPPGAGFYPSDMGKTEYEAFLSKTPASRAAFESPFTVIKRDRDRWLYAVPFHIEYDAHVKKIAAVLDEASKITSSSTLRRYLGTRAAALLNDEYADSDKAWLDIGDNGIDAVVAPYETYDDQLLGLKASYEGVFLVTDEAATRELAGFRGQAAELEKNLPVGEEFKKQKTGSASPILVYNVAGLAGQANAGIKSIAASLPNDEKVREEKGAKTLIFKNVMKAKFDTILMPIAKALVVKSQLPKVKFDVFFQHSLLHELAHPLGLNYVFRDGKLTNIPVRTALKERYSTIEECKADTIGLYNIGYFVGKGAIKPEKETDAYVTQLASIFRTVRFGAGEDHGKANMIQFNFLREKGAIRLDPGSGAFSIDAVKMKEGVKELGALLLSIEAKGDYDAAGELIAKLGGIPPELKDALARLTDVPTDIDFVPKPRFPKGIVVRKAAPADFYREGDTGADVQASGSAN
jgi:hypothetical protein